VIIATSADPTTLSRDALGDRRHRRGRRGRAARDRDVQPPRPPPQPHGERLGAGRRAAAPPVRPDPEPRRDGQGLRRARARDVRGGHARPDRGAGREDGRGAGAEDYPELRATENFQQLQGELAETEEKIRVARQIYNDAVLSYENARETVPTSIVAAVFNFEERPYFEIEDEAAREAPQVRF
jgi:hypothetical protein